MTRAIRTASVVLFGGGVSTDFEDAVLEVRDFVVVLGVCVVSVVVSHRSTIHNSKDRQQPTRGFRSLQDVSQRRRRLYSV